MGNLSFGESSAQIECIECIEFPKFLIGESSVTEACFHMRIRHQLKVRDVEDRSRVEVTQLQFFFFFLSF